MDRHISKIALSPAEQDEIRRTAKHERRNGATPAPGTAHEHARMIVRALEPAMQSTSPTVHKHLTGCVTEYLRVFRTADRKLSSGARHAKAKKVALQMLFDRLAYDYGADNKLVSHFHRYARNQLDEAFSGTR